MSDLSWALKIGAAKIVRLEAELAAAQERVAALETEAAYWNHHYNELMLEFHDAAPAVVREMRQPAMTQYLKGNTTIVATREEWDERYTSGWNDGNSDAKEGGPQVCSVCDGDGEIEDNSHLVPPVYGDWPMVTCPKCNGTGVDAQPKEGGK